MIRKKLSKIKKMNLKQVNAVLSIILFLLSIYIMSMPFLPELELMLRRNSDNTEGFVYQSKAAVEAGIDEELLQPIPDENRIVIPKISVDAEVKEGGDISILDQGQAWRRPMTSKPDIGGNTVIVGHRYFGQGKNTFYHLNKLSVGDEIIVFWDKDEYKYVINSVFETVPENISIEQNTDDTILTLYTCSGLAAERRLIIKALPVIDEGEV